MPVGTFDGSIPNKVSSGSTSISRRSTSSAAMLRRSGRGPHTEIRLRPPESSLAAETNSARSPASRVAISWRDRNNPRPVDWSTNPQGSIRAASIEPPRNSAAQLTDSSIATKASSPVDGPAPSIVRRRRARDRSAAAGVSAVSILIPAETSGASARSNAGPSAVARRTGRRVPGIGGEAGVMSDSRPLTGAPTPRSAVKASVRIRS